MCIRKSTVEFRVSRKIRSPRKLAKFYYLSQVARDAEAWLMTKLLKKTGEEELGIAHRSMSVIYFS